MHQPVPTKGSSVSPWVKFLVVETRLEPDQALHGDLELDAFHFERVDLHDGFVQRLLCILHPPRLVAGCLPLIGQLGPSAF